MALPMFQAVPSLCGVGSLNTGLSLLNGLSQKLKLTRCVASALSTKFFIVSRPKSSRAKIYVGDRLPNIPLYEGSPDKPVSASELYKGKRGVLFAVVGAFTPGCTQSHIPDYLSLYDKFKEEGYLISCVSVNDPFVMKAWGQSTNAEGKIHMLADPSGEFTKAMGMELDCKQLLGGIRSHKYSVVVDDGIIQSINVDPEHTGLACLLCIKSMKASAPAT